MTRVKRCLTDEEKAYIREHISQSTYNQVARDIGRSPTAVRRYAKSVSMESNRDAVLEAKRRGSAMRSGDWRGRISKTRKELFHKERMRERWCVEPKTRIKARSMPARLRSLRKLLRRYQNYLTENCNFYDSDPYVFYYDGTTKRRKDEAELVQKYGVRFEPLEEEKNYND